MQGGQRTERKSGSINRLTVEDRRASWITPHFIGETHTGSFTCSSQISGYFYPWKEHQSEQLLSSAGKILSHLICSHQTLYLGTGYHLTARKPRYGDDEICPVWQGIHTVAEEAEGGMNSVPEDAMPYPRIPDVCVLAYISVDFHWFKDTKVKWCSVEFALSKHLLPPS